jgi:hypothetical protein
MATETLYVRKTPGVGEFSSINAALATISDAAADKPYIIAVDAGVYVESVIDLAAKPYVSVKGESIMTTIVKTDGVSDTIFKVGTFTELSFMTIEGNYTAAVGVSCINPGLFSGLHKCTLQNCDRLIDFRSTADFTPASYLQLEYCDFEGFYSTGLHQEAQGGQVNSLITNFVAIPLQTDSISIHTIGSNVSCHVQGPTLIEDYSGPTFEGHASIGIKAENGCQLEVTNSDVWSFKEAIVIASGGAAPRVRLTDMRLNYNDTDVKNSHPSTIGIFQGIARQAKMDLLSAATQFIMNYRDIDTSKIVASGSQWSLSGGIQVGKVSAINNKPPMTGSNGTGNNSAPLIATRKRIEQLEDALNEVLEKLKNSGLMKS